MYFCRCMCPLSDSVPRLQAAELKKEKALNKQAGAGSPVRHNTARVKLEVDLLAAPAAQSV